MLFLQKNFTSKEDIVVKTAASTALMVLRKRRLVLNNLYSAH